MLQYDADQALAIAMNPNSGEILALASFPSYDPTKFSEVDPGIYNRNLPVFMSYEPGSTFKIITLSAAIEEGLSIWIMTSFMMRAIRLLKEHVYAVGTALVISINRFGKLCKIPAIQALWSLGSVLVQKNYWIIFTALDLAKNGLEYCRRVYGYFV